MRRIRRRRQAVERKQATDFKESVCCSSAVVQGQHSKKMKWSAGGNFRCNVKFFSL